MGVREGRQKWVSLYFNAFSVSEYFICEIPASKFLKKHPPSTSEFIISSFGVNQQEIQQKDFIKQFFW